MYPPINNIQQPHTNSIKVYEHPLILLKKKFPPSSVRPWNTAHPKAADAAASFFDPGGEFSKKKLRPQFSSLRPHQDQGLVPQSPCNWGCGVVEEDEVVCFLSAKKNLNLHKNGRSGILKMWCLSISKKTCGPSLLKFWVASYMQPSLVKLYHLNSCFHFTPPKGQSHWCSRWRSSLGQTSPRNQQRWTESNKKSSCSQFQPHETLPGSVFEKIHFWVQWVRFW